MAKLIGIATHQQSKGPISLHQHISVTTESGLEDDYQGQKKPQAQVTLLSKKTWDLVCQQLNTEIDWRERRANLLIDEIDFNESMIGQQIQIGSVLLEITRETDPCARMTQLHPGLKEALTPDWRGGARCKVLRKGLIQEGDVVTILKRF